MEWDCISLVCDDNVLEKLSNKSISYHLLCRLK